MKKLYVLLVILSSCTREYVRIDENIPEYSKAKNRVALPLSVNLYCPPVGDQGSEGSCAVWSTAYYARSIEHYYKTNKETTFSVEYVYNQSKSGSCTSGTSFSASLNILQAQGDCLYSTMPGVDGECSVLPNATQIAEASNYKIDGYSKVAYTDRQTIKELLYQNHPVCFNAIMDDSFINAPNDSNWVWKTKSPTGSFPDAKTIIGYDDNRNAYHVVSSWGVGWGYKGFSWIDYNFFETGGVIGAYTYVLVPATQTPVVQDTFLLSGYSKTIRGKVHDVLSWKMKYTVAPKAVYIEYLNTNIYSILPSAITGSYTYKAQTKYSRSYRLKIIKDVITYSNTVSL